jgi:hypothetical protein
MTSAKKFRELRRRLALRDEARDWRTRAGLGTPMTAAIIQRLEKIDRLWEARDLAAIYEKGWGDGG